MPAKPSVDLEKLDAAVIATATDAADKALAGDEAGLLHRAAVLEALKSVKGALAPNSTPPRWPPAAIFIVTALLLAYLLGKPDTAVIAFDVSTRALDANLAAGSSQAEYLPFSTARIPVRSLFVEGMVSPLPANAPMGRSAIGASLTSDQWKTLVLEELHVVAPAGTDARLNVTADASSLRVCASSPLSVQTRGVRNAGPEVELTVVLNVSPHTGTAGAYRRVLGQACVTLALDEGTTFSLTTQLPVREVSVSGPAAVPQGTDPLAVVFPTALVSGKLTFPEVPSAQYEFGPDERLGLVGAKGMLRKVQWKKDQLVLSFRGTAAEVTRSAGQLEQKLIPSRLSHLRSSQSDLILAWGVLLYLFGLALSLYKWIGGRK